MPPLDLGPVPALKMPEASAVAGVEYAAARGWLYSGALPLIVPQGASGKWYRIFPIDVLRLAVAGGLIRFGVSRAEAGGIVAQHVDPAFDGILAVAANAPWPLVVSHLFGRTIHVSRNCEHLVVTPGDSAGPHGPAVLSVDIGRIARDCADRARTLNSKETEQ